MGVIEFYFLYIIFCIYSWRETVIIKKTAVIPPLIALATFILSPEFYNKLPDKYAHIIAGIAILVSTFLPSLITKEIK